MDINLLFLFIVLALLAEVLGTIGGFGSSLFFVPIAGYFLDFHSVLGITAVFHIFSNLSKIVLFRKGVHWNIILTLGIPATLFVIVGAVLSNYITTTYLQLILAMLLIILSLFFLIFRKQKIRPNSRNAIISGVLSGLTAGLVGTGGAIRGLALSALHLQKEVFIATSAVIDLGIDVSRSIVYTTNGFLKTNDLYLIPILLVVSVAGTFVGKLLLKRISNIQFRLMVLILIFLVGVFTLYRYWFLL